jgi:hypothetical protein
MKKRSKLSYNKGQLYRSYQTKSIYQVQKSISKKDSYDATVSSLVIYVSPLSVHRVGQYVSVYIKYLQKVNTI